MDCQNLLCRIVVIPLVICTLLACGETEDTPSVALSETGIEGDTASFSGPVVDEGGCGFARKSFFQTAHPCK